MGTEGSPVITEPQPAADGQNSSDRSGSPWGYFALVALGGVVLCAIPFFGGLFGLTVGGYLLVLNRRGKGWALLHMSSLPLAAIADGHLGDKIRICGRITSTPEIIAPLSGKRVVYAAVTVQQETERAANRRDLEPTHLGEGFSVRDDTGQAQIILKNVHVLSCHTHDLTEGRQAHPPLRQLYQVPEGYRLLAQEMTLDHGDEVDVVGTVVASKDVVASQPGDYRQSGSEKHLTLSSPEGDDEGMRVTNMTPTQLRGVLSAAPAFLAVGILWVLAGAGSLAALGWTMVG